MERSVWSIDGHEEQRRLGDQMALSISLPLLSVLSGNAHDWMQWLLFGIGLDTVRVLARTIGARMDNGPSVRSEPECDSQTEDVPVDTTLFTRRNIEPAIIGGIGLWLVVGLGDVTAGALRTGSSPVTAWGDRSISWYAATFAASLVVGAMLTFAQTRQTDQRLRSAVTAGLMMGILGAVGVLATGINAGTMSIAGPRAAILLFGVIAASMLVFARRVRPR